MLGRDRRDRRVDQTRRDQTRANAESHASIKVKVGTRPDQTREERKIDRKRLDTFYLWVLSQPPSIPSEAESSEPNIEFDGILRPAP